MLCASVEENKRPKLFVVPANNPRASGKAAFWSFAGGAIGKPVLSSRQVRLCSMNCGSCSENLLRGEDGRVGLTLEEGGRNISSGEDIHHPIPRPHDASFCWFVEVNVDRNVTSMLLGEEVTEGAAASGNRRTTLPSSTGSQQQQRMNQRPPIITPSPRSKTSPRRARNTDTMRRSRADSMGSDAPLTRPAFSPCSPTRAKDALSRDGMTVSVGIPYSALDDLKRKQAKDQRDGRLAGCFVVPASEGYSRYIDRGGQFLHSPDTRCISMEQNFLKERAENGLKILSAKHANRRRHWMKQNNSRKIIEDGT